MRDSCLILLLLHEFKRTHFSKKCYRNIARVGIKVSIKLIVGLGNPGQQYEMTRHNAGQWFVERLANVEHISLKAEKSYQGLLGRGCINSHDIRLLIPTPFMNLSGQSVQAVANFYKIEPQQILVVHDELDLDPGSARLKKEGGHGGHNGLKSIIQCLGNRKDFIRLRLGIGHPGDKNLVTNYVLSKPSQVDKKLIDQAIDNSLTIFQHLLNDKLELAMNHLHSL